MKKIIMLLSGPCDSILDPDPRVENEAEALTKAGYNVKLFAWDRELKSKRIEKIKGLRIERIRIKSTFGKGSKQIFKFLKFNQKLFFKLLRSNFDIVHCHDFDTLIPGFLAAKLKRKKLVFDSHEFYPAMMKDQGLKSLSKIANKLQSFIAKRVNLIIAVNHLLQRIFKRLNKNTRLIMNCKKLEEFQNIKNNPLKKYKNIKKFLYIGAFSPGRNLLELIDIFKDKQNAILVLGGNGYLEKQIKNRLHKNILFLGRVKKEDVPKYTLASDYLLAIYQSNLLNNDIAGPPNKLFEAIAAGKPIITNKRGSTAEIVKKTGCGITVDSSNIEEIDKLITNLISNKKLQLKLNKKSKQAQSRYNWANESKKLKMVYDSLKEGK